MYYFCVRAYNLAGESETSDIVNCMTLAQGESEMTGMVSIMMLCLFKYLFTAIAIKLLILF